MSTAVLEVSEFDGFYGSVPILQSVNFTVGSEPFVILGRNGMGKTTLCRALMGLLPKTTGRVTFLGDQVVGSKPHKIATRGVGYVPQGRGIFPSLSTDEHLRMLRPSSKSSWQIDDVYELFPRLHQRRKIGAGQMSGGEQQMLAIGRVLLSDPRLLILDEPSEGLAPSIVTLLAETLTKLNDAGVSILLVEQNVRLAAAVGKTAKIMTNGSIGAEVDCQALISDEEVQRRFLGVDVASK